MNERYQIKERIGHGGLGEVFIALDTQLQREVALKRMKAAEGQSPDDLIKEAKVLSALQHPNILTVFDLGQDEQGAFVITELLRGETLEQVITRGPLRYEDFRQMALQSLEGLVAAQALNLIHRDLKPGNLMVTWHASGKFQVKILDFGLAKFSQQASRQTEDQEAGIMGSIFYMAPEQFERQPLDGRTDLYALGSIFYFSLTGKNPFDGDTAPVVMGAHLTHRVTPLIQVRPDLPPWVCDWVMWFINRDPADRPSSAQEALDAFQQQAAAWDAAVQAAPLAAAAARASAPPASAVVSVPGRSARDALRATGRTQGVRRPTSSVPAHGAKRSWLVFALPTLLAAAALYGLWQWKRAQDAARALEAGDVGLTIDSIRFPDSPAPTVAVKGIPVGAGTTPLPLSQANTPRHPHPPAHQYQCPRVLERSRHARDLGHRRDRAGQLRGPRHAIARRCQDGRQIRSSRRRSNACRRGAPIPLQKPVYRGPRRHRETRERGRHRRTPAYQHHRDFTDEPWGCGDA